MFREKVTFIIFPGVRSGSYEGFLFIGSNQEAHVRRRLLDADEESQWNPGMTVQDSFTYRRANSAPNTLALREWAVLKDTDEVKSALMEQLDEYKHKNPNAYIKSTPSVKVVSAVEAMIHRNRASRHSSLMSEARDIFFTRR